MTYFIPLVRWCCTLLPLACLPLLADPGAAVIEGNARFTVVTPRVIRMEYVDSLGFEDRATLTFVNRAVPSAAYQVRRESGWLQIQTEALRLRYKMHSGRFDSSNLFIEFQTGGREGRWCPGTPNTGNLKGTTRTLDGTDGDLIIKDSSRVMLEDGLISRDGWVLIDDSRVPVFDTSDWPWVSARPARSLQDLYFFAYGNQYKTALKDFTLIAGRIAMPPRYVFGYWFSRWRSFSEMELREVVETFRSLNIPLDVLLVDMDWHITALPEFFDNNMRKKDQAGESFGWTGFTWNTSYFPKPEKFLGWLKDKGLKVSLNLHPASGIQPHEAQYEPMARAMGIDPATRKYVPFNIVDKRFAQQYFDLLLHPLERSGVDFWWLDWQQWNTTAIPGVNPTFYLNYVHYTDMERRKSIRPLIYHRWGGLGNHRYQIGFSGDTKIGWRSLEYQPYFTTTAANVGFGYWGNDIGGFFGEPNTPENFLRWFQYGIFSPIVKTHATSRNFSILRKLWEYPPEVFLQLRALVELRYALIPYIYTESRRAYDDGIALCHPLYYEHPLHEEAYRFRNEYFFGGDMLVHPVTRSLGADSLFVSQASWLPPGMWYEYSSGELLSGGRVLERPFTASEIPLYIRGGAIIPSQPGMMYVGEKPVDPLILTCYPGADRGETRLYEDDGTTNRFKQGQYCFTHVTSRIERNVQTITLLPAEGRYAGMPLRRSYELRFPCTYPPLKVTMDGRDLAYNGHENAVGWRYDGSELMTIVTLPARSVDTAASIRIDFPPAVDAQRLYGMKRKFAALYRFSKFLSDQRSYRKQDLWNDAKYSSEAVMELAQTSLRITEDPQSIRTEMEGFGRRWTQLMQMLEEISKEQKIFHPQYEVLMQCR